MRAALALLALLGVAAPLLGRAQTADDSLTALLMRGDSYLLASQFDSALAVYRAALPLSRSIGDRKREASTLGDIAAVFRDTGHPDSALAYYRIALPLRRANGDQQGEAWTLSNIGLAFHAVGQPDSALLYFRSALRLSRRVSDHETEGTVLGNIGMVYYGTGHPDSALAYYRASLPLDHAVGDSTSEAATLANIGEIFRHTGHPDSALVYLRAALPLRGAVEDRVRAVTLTTLGDVYSGVGQIDTALVYYRAALSIRRATSDRVGEATTLVDVGVAYYATGRSDSALAYFREALALQRAARDRAEEAATLGNIGEVFRLTGRPDSALAYHRASLPIRRAIGDRGGEATALGSVGSIFLGIGKLDSALTYYRASLTLLRAVEDRAGEATTLNNIGVVYADGGRRDSALAYHRRALQLHRAVGDRVGEAADLNNIGSVYGEMGRLDSALATLDSASATYAKVRLRAGSDASAVAFAEQERGTIELWVRAWLSLARAADGTGTTATTRGGARSSSETAVAAALAAAERGRAQGLRDLLARSAASVGATRAEDLWARDTVPGADLAAEAARELAPLRHTRTAALYYFVSGDTLTTWLLAPTGTLRLPPRGIVRNDSLATLITTLRAVVGADAARTRMARGAPFEQERGASGMRGVEDEAGPEARSRLRAAAAALGTLLLPDSLARLAPAGTDVVIVPHGVLALVPFAALTVPGDTSPLGTRYALRYAPSLRALGAAEARRAGWESATTRGPSAARVLVVGDPAMPSVTAVDGQRVPLRDLPAARAEGEAVARRFDVAALTGRAATETAVRRALPRATLVHLATHGLAYGSEAKVRDSYVALAPDSANDGLLTIGELLDDVPPLSADLVVLSACQTGLGNLQQAEGTVGFQRALLAKGARSVLVSLWSVDDRATALLMQRFYAHWLGTDGRPARSKAEALRLAQDDVRRTPGFASPRYWAAFQLVGAR